jgi:large subunit ribosomal protein L2
MALVKVKPTSAGRRAVVKVVSPNLHKGAPVASLVEKQSKTAGRNNNGHITTRHKGGGHKQHYRLVDFRRNKDGIVAKVERLEYDPNRSAISRCCATPTASVATSSPRRGGGRSDRRQRFRSSDQVR